MNEVGLTDDLIETLTPDGVTPEGVAEDTPPPKRKSRWVIGSGVPRYDKKTLDSLHDQYAESAGWYRGARVPE